jgi:hypothetical protein
MVLFFRSLPSDVLIDRVIRLGVSIQIHFLHFNLVAQATYLDEGERGFIEHDIEHLIIYHIIN